jgi:hypothetical protein
MGPTAFGRPGEQDEPRALSPEKRQKDGTSGQSEFDTIAVSAWVCEIGVYKKNFPKLASISSHFADWTAAVNRKIRNPDADQILKTLREHSFDLTRSPDVAGGVLVSKHGAGAVLVATQGKEAGIALAVRPGALVGGQVGLLLDRGYQKFIKFPQFELPATVRQLHGIHMFSEELKQLTGTGDLYNEALGTTSDLHEYDRLKGREAVQPALRRPWNLEGKG